MPTAQSNGVTRKREFWSSLVSALIALLLVMGVALDVRAGRGALAAYTPTTPSGLSVTKDSDSINLFWNLSSYAAFYEIWRSSNESGPYTFLDMVDYPTQVYFDTNISCGQTYYYKVRAGNSGLYSGFTNPDSESTAACILAADRCEDVTVLITEDFLENASTAGASDDYSPSGSGCTQAGTNPGSGPDTVYGIQAASSCYVRVCTFNGFAYLLSGGCGNGAVCLDTPVFDPQSASRCHGFRAEAGEIYYVVMEALDQSPTYQISVEFFGCNTDVPSCGSVGTLASQPPALYGTTESAAYLAANGTLDDFTINGGTVNTVRWWGLEMTQPNGSVDCGPQSTLFDLEFYGPGSTPGALIAPYTVSATAVDTGTRVEQNTVWAYEATLPAPFTAESGWLRIAPAVQDTCYWHWAGSANGNQNAVVDTNPLSLQAVDFAFCLLGEATQHTADQTGDGVISLSELLRVIQFYNTGAFHCDAQGEDGYAPAVGATNCTPHASDYNPQDWIVSLSELLRVIQFYNSLGYYSCPGQGTEDSYCPGTGP